MKDIESLILVPPVNILTLYQDCVTQHWALELCESAKRQCSPGEVHWTCWNLALLSEPEVFAGASASAREANLIVVAAYAWTELSRDLKRWLDACLPEAQLHRGALVALLGEHSAAPCPARDYLTRLADSAQVDYFLREFTLQTHLADLTFESIDARVHTTTSVLSEMLLRSQRARVTATTWEHAGSL